MNGLKSLGPVCLPRIAPGWFRERACFHAFGAQKLPCLSGAVGAVDENLPCYAT